MKRMSFEKQLLLAKLEQNYQRRTTYHKVLKDLVILKIIPNWLQLVVFLLLLTTTNSQCYVSCGIQGSEICTICLNNNAFVNCTYKYNLTNTSILNQSSCSNYCCSTDIKNSIPFCNDNNQSSTSDTDNLPLATTMIIIFFTIFGCLCLVIILIACYRRSSNRTFLLDVRIVTLSGTNLANFNVDEIGPLYQDSKQACSICLQQRCKIRTNCGHRYHHQCLYDWIKKKQNCPLCVSKDFNPIVAYCNKCYISIKLVVLMQKMNDHAEQQWRNLDVILCQACIGSKSDPHDISIDLSSQIIQNRRDDAENMDQLDPTGKVQSNRCITL